MLNLELDTIAKELVSYPSISPYQKGAIDYLIQLITPMGFKCEVLKRNNTTNLIATYGDKGEIFAFAGHIDIVPPGDDKLWLHNPYELTLEQDKLYGRGIADMKGAVSAFIYAVYQYLQNTTHNNGQIMLLITSDEESSAKDGTIVMVEYLQKHNIQIQYCLIGEPSSVKYLGDTIKIGRRGSLTGELTLNGKQGHIAYPDLCINPINSFANAFCELTNTVWDNGNEYFPPTSLQFANINAGVGVTNVIPSTLTCNFNFRYNNLQNSDKLITQVEAILNKHNLNYNIIWADSAKPFYCKVGKLATIVQQEVYQQTNIITSFKTDGGTSDGRFLYKICNEILEFGLPNYSIHQVNEHIEYADLNKLAKIYEQILNKIFND